MAEMAETGSSTEPEAGAPIARDAIDPDLIKLARTKIQIGIVTCLGVLVLCVYFMLRLGPDRRFAGEDERPVVITVDAITSGKAELERHVTVEAQLLLAHAMRAGKTHADVGLRLVPVRGSSERVWVALTTDVSVKPLEGRYTGRLRAFADLPVAEALQELAASRPRPAFATPSAVRAAFATGKLTSVAGDALVVADGDRVAFDLVVADAATIIASLNERTPDAAAWQKTLAAASLPATLVPATDRDVQLRQLRFDVPLSVAATNGVLQAANLWATRVEPVNRHHDTTWGALKKSGPAGFTVGNETIPEAQLPLVGLYVARAIPADARVVIVGELPADYWYVTPITVALAVIGLLFAWALVRAIRRDLLPTRGSDKLTAVV